ncbi:MAG: acyl-CoA dehydrogenase family protein [Pseudomonadota bacterium]
MDFQPTQDQQSLIDGIQAALAPYDDAYWAEADKTATFPHEFHAAMAAGGWLGIALPQDVGGTGLGVTEAALMMLEVAKKAGMSGASAIHMNIFGPKAIDLFATPQQRHAWLPPLIQGTQKTCFAVTEPNTGLDTTQLQTRAVRQGDRYTLNGRKIWTSTAQVSEKMMILARTAPYDAAAPTHGLSLFYTDLDRNAVDVRRIDKMGRAAVDSNELFIDNLNVPANDLIGEEGQGFRYILQSLNPERILIAAEAVGIGLQALDRATSYARDREVFGRPIGQNQAIQHPLAAAWAKLQAARLLTLQAATLFDKGQPCGVEANAAKYLAAETALDACRQAMATHGGMGYAREYHVERLFREILIPYLAPVSQQLALCYVAERGLGLPKSY